ncbi:MAG: hypothetical protein AAGA03_15040 [Planctomycetota bacterium]
MMLKRILFAAAPLMLIAGSVTADDNLLASIAMLDANTADATMESEAGDDLMGAADVDALLSDGEETSDEEAIAACFRRIGFGYGYGGYRGYRGYRGFNSWHSPIYRGYNHCHYPVVRHYRPISYSCFTPVYSSYWGCW